MLKWVTRQGLFKKADFGLDHDCIWEDAFDVMWLRFVMFLRSRSAVCKQWCDSEEICRTVLKDSESLGRLTWVTSNSWVHTSGNQNAPPHYAPLYAHAFSAISLFTVLLQETCHAELQQSHPCFQLSIRQSDSNRSSFTGALSQQMNKEKT